MPSSPAALFRRSRYFQELRLMKIFTIGFTKKSAEAFFTRLQRAGVKRLVDVRLNNVSQLAGFTKKNDLRYFTKAICNIEYVHLLDLAPTSEILDAYKKTMGIGRSMSDGFSILCTPGISRKPCLARSWTARASYVAKRSLTIATAVLLPSI